ncbi:MAG: hypothetical protein QNK04_32150 [Myxococcota bacterium]|nr:hypothetical protein [Myxococcota bacterium]
MPAAPVEIETQSADIPDAPPTTLVNGIYYNELDAETPFGRARRRDRGVHP